jgi:hypothetical protein
MTRRGWLAGLAAALLAPRPARAHAFLERAEPRVGSTLRSPPPRVRLWFTEQIEAAFSTVQVLAAASERVDRRDVTVDAADRRLLQVSLPPLAPGAYRVAWRVLSIDSHVTEGDFTFRVAP